MFNKSLFLQKQTTVRNITDFSRLRLLLNTLYCGATVIVSGQLTSGNSRAKVAHKLFYNLFFYVSEIPAKDKQSYVFVLEMYVSVTWFFPVINIGQDRYCIARLLRQRASSFEVQKFTSMTQWRLIVAFSKTYPADHRLIHDPGVVRYLSKQFFHEVRHHLHQLPPQVWLHLLQQLLSVGVNEEIQRRHCKQTLISQYVYIRHSKNCQCSQVKSTVCRRLWAIK